MIARLWDWMRGFFVRSEQTMERAGKEKSQLQAEREQSREDAKITGAFVSIETLVADAKERLADLRSMKFRGDANYDDIAAFCRNVGTFVVGPDVEIRGDVVESRSRPYILVCSLPFCLGDDSDKDKTGYDYNYMIRKTASEARRHGVFSGTLYEMGVGCPKSDRAPSFWGQTCLIKVSDSGKANLLMGQRKYAQSVGNGRNGQIYMAQSYGPHCLDVSHDWVSDFYAMMNMAVLRDLHWSVSVSDGVNKVSYSIPQNDAPRMFKKRTGSGKKIFHAVAAHQRSNGANVRQHFRGERRFLMDDLEVNIQVPGLHRGSLALLPAWAEDGDNRKKVSLEDASENLGHRMGA